MNINTPYELIFVIAQYTLVLVGAYLMVCGLLANINIIFPMFKQKRLEAKADEIRARQELEALEGEEEC